MNISSDKKRFTEVYNKESDALFRFCLFRVSDKERAMDLTQEAFTKLWVAMCEGKAMENPRAFLYAVTRNMIIDWYRRIKAVSLESMYNEEEERGFDKADEHATRQIEISSDATRVLEVLNKLDGQYKEIMYLRFVEDLPPKEIAIMLGMNANSVSIRITRGIESMRKIMGFSKKDNE